MSVAEHAPIAGIDRMGLVLKKARYAATLVNNPNGIAVDHPANDIYRYKETPILFEVSNVWDYLCDAGCSHEEIGKVFEFSGELKTYQGEWLNFEDITVEELDATLRARLAPVYAMVNRSLDFAHKLGFNRHGECHIDEVTNRALEILNVVGANEEEKKIAVLIARTHDIGNLISRSTHAHVSAEMLEAFIPDFMQDAQVAKKTRRGVRLHDESVAMAMIDSIKNKLINEDKYSQKALYEEIREIFGIEALAILAADKSHAVDRVRVSEKDTGTTMFNDDMHSEVCALLSSSKYKIDLVHGVVGREVKFKPGLGKDEEQATQLEKHAMQKSNGDIRIKVSDQMHELHQKEGIPHSMSTQGEMWDLHANRIKLEAMAIFALFDEVNDFMITISDKDDCGNNGSGMMTKYRFTRGNLDREIEYLQENYRFGKEGRPPVFFQKIRDFWRLRLILDQQGDALINPLARVTHDSKYISLSMFDEELGAPPGLVETLFVINTEEKDRMKRFLTTLFVPKETRKSIDCSKKTSNLYITNNASMISYGV